MNKMMMIMMMTMIFMIIWILLRLPRTVWRWDWSVCRARLWHCTGWSVLSTTTRTGSSPTPAPVTPTTSPRPSPSAPPSPSRPPSPATLITTCRGLPAGQGWAVWLCWPYLCLLCISIRYKPRRPSVITARCTHWRQQDFPAINQQFRRFILYQTSHTHAKWQQTKEQKCLTSSNSSKSFLSRSILSNNSFLSSSSSLPIVYKVYHCIKRNVSMLYYVCILVIINPRWVIFGLWNWSDWSWE